MKNNRVIFLNGPSSSGKTTLAKKLQEVLEQPYLHIGIDKVIGMMPAKYNDWTGGKAEHGFYWELASDEEGKQLAHIQSGPFAQKISSLLRELVLTMLAAGHNVIVDEVCALDDSFERWKKVLAPYDVLYVGLKAPTELLESRERERGDRMIGSARAQNLHVHAGKEYGCPSSPCYDVTSRHSLYATADCVLEVDKLSLDECVEKIIRAMEGKYENILGR